EQEAAAVADVRIIGAELMAVIAQRQRLGQAAGQRLEAAEMRDPLFVAERIEADAGRRAIVAETQDRPGDARSRYGIVECLAGGEDRLLRSEGHPAIWGRMGDRRNLTAWEDRFWWSRDGLRLHYRDYAGPADK